MGKQNKISLEFLFCNFSKFLSQNFPTFPTDLESKLSDPEVKNEQKRQGKTKNIRQQNFELILYGKTIQNFTRISFFVIFLHFSSQL